ncbi:hypothetical protein VTL71DRAFT_4394 [Oculimacula yallundae]|uniref:Uncharacterized protein n=1 Tax=Oculimacula yallundae TaxID=86028 RepID=A0ABR4C1V8_9HELO
MPFRNGGPNSSLRNRIPGFPHTCHLTRTSPKRSPKRGRAYHHESIDKNILSSACQEIPGLESFKLPRKK